MKPSDISYIEQRLAERPFRFEELYFEILDHVLCKYEDSGSEDVEAFWEEEKAKLEKVENLYAKVQVPQPDDLAIS